MEMLKEWDTCGKLCLSSTQSQPFIASLSFPPSQPTKMPSSFPSRLREALVAPNSRFCRSLYFPSKSNAPFRLSALVRFDLPVSTKGPQLLSDSGAVIGKLRAQALRFSYAASSVILTLALPRRLLNEPVLEQLVIHHGVCLVIDREICIPHRGVFLRLNDEGLANKPLKITGPGYSAFRPFEHGGQLREQYDKYAGPPSAWPARASRTSEEQSATLLSSVRANLAFVKSSRAPGFRPDWMVPDAALGGGVTVSPSGEILDFMVLMPNDVVTDQNRGRSITWILSLIVSDVYKRHTLEVLANSRPNE
ncbi:hypothetical protein QBC45DRAFT_486784 [Copromyces sp. CBS 386.78]|nr:hypothetical protein QBC45DRAFT_486784 [Copromyces sp. CBS 386.78]